MDECWTQIYIARHGVVHQLHSVGLIWKAQDLIPTRVEKPPVLRWSDPGNITHCSCSAGERSGLQQLGVCSGLGYERGGNFTL